MSRSSQPPYLRLVESSNEVISPRREETDGTLLGFVDMSRASDIGLEMILSRIRPAWVFDLRPVPYFDIGRLNRKRMFDLFRRCCTSYRDVAGSLRITDHNDASLNSGAIGSFLSATLSQRPSNAPIVVLVDDEETLGHAMHVLPRTLRTVVDTWCPMALDVEGRDGVPDVDVVVRRPNGEFCLLEAKWLTRESATASVVEGFRIWLGDSMFAVTFEFDDGRATQVALPMDAVISLEHHLEAAISRCAAIRGTVPMYSSQRSPAQRVPHEQTHVIALRVECVQIREMLDGQQILITFGYPHDAKTHALFTVEGAQLLRAQIQDLYRR